MSETLRPRPSGGRLFGGIMFGVLIGVLSPLLLLLASLIFLAPVLTARLYAHSGPWPALVSAAAQMLMALLLFGPVGAAMVLLALVLPLLWTLRGLARARPFFEQLRITIPVWMLCAVLAFLLGNYLTGGLVDAALAALESEMAALPNGLQDLLLSAFTGAEIPSALNAGLLQTSLYLRMGFLGAAERAAALSSMLLSMRNAAVVLLPGLLLGSAALTAFFAAAWPCRALVRAGKLPGECWQPLFRWHLPVGLTFGALGLFLASLVLYRGFDAAGAEAVYAAVTMLAGLAFRAQAAGSLERRLLNMRVKPGLRATAIWLFVLLPAFNTISFYYGMFSALFGPSYGAVTQLMKRRGGGDGEDS